MKLLNLITTFLDDLNNLTDDDLADVPPVLVVGESLFAAIEQLEYVEQSLVEGVNV
jgi:hypothetical protein